MKHALTLAIFVASSAMLAPSVHASEEPPEGRAHHLVGHVDRLLNVKGTLGENRPVIVHTWYPAQAPKDCDDSRNSQGNRDNQRCSKHPSVYTSRLYGVPLGTLGDPLSWTIGSTQSFDNLRINTEDGPFPVVVFSHGNSNNAIDYAYTLEALASFGFIVAAPDHLNNTQDDVRIDYINSQAGFTLIRCFDGLPSPCSRLGLGFPKLLTDRVHDISAVITKLPDWFGNRVDTSRVGLMGHSFGADTTVAAAGGSVVVPGDPRVRAIMGLANSAPYTHPILGNVPNVAVPTLLVAGELDVIAPFQTSKDIFDKVGTALPTSPKKELVLIGHAKHRHHTSGLCAIAQSAGAIATRNPRAILDLHTLRYTVIGPMSGGAKDFCGFDTFTEPVDIRSLVFSLTGFSVSPDNVPTTGLLSSEVKEEVTDVAVGFFARIP
jgi:dienelactone hydrolase